MSDGKKEYVQLSARVETLREITKIQCQPENVREGGYMRGMANGMILALATMEGKTPKYVKRCGCVQREDGECLT